MVERGGRDKSIMKLKQAPSPGLEVSGVTPSSAALAVVEVVTSHGVSNQRTT